MSIEHHHQALPWRHNNTIMRRRIPSPSPSPSPSPLPWTPSPSPLPLSDLLLSNSNSSPTPPTSSKQPIDFSPPLIAMVVIAAAAFLIVTYSRLLSRHFLPPLLRQFRRYRRWRRRRRPSHILPDSPPYEFDSLHFYGLEDSVIKSMPLSLFSHTAPHHLPPPNPNLHDFPADCAVCLVEFVDRDYVRTLPLCAHSFHVDCIDVWLRSHATCPLCRAGVLPPTEWSPFVPVDLHSFLIDPPAPARTRSDSVTTVPEIVQESEGFGRPQLMKRSYSFGFERNFSSERIVMDPATASPWRQYQRRRSFSFWRRPSPFSSISKPRVFSFRSSRKSPFLGRRRGAMGAMSEGMRYSYYGAGSKSMASPMFGRASVSSRMRCGDPEALISPERYGGRGS